MERILDLGKPPNSSPPKKNRIQRGAACVACRTKKRRCNGARPACSSCVYDSEPECLYTPLNVKPRTLILQQKVNDLEAQVNLLQSLNLNAAGGSSGSALQLRHHSHTTTSSPRLSAGLGEQAFRSTVSSQMHSPVATPHEPSTGIGPLIGSWWTTDEPPPSGLITIFTNLFAEKEHHHTHDPRPPQFYESFHDPNPDIGPHQALRNVVYLLACEMDGNLWSKLEPVFLRRTTYYLGLSLAQADRLLDYIDAYTLFAMYTVVKGR
ncbi:hypothetical protein BOTBODRAFT_225273 [Botryobasidium botryosum FD-172 SS1]|uniref:Zn(2)-C6 fungal-type domain-containing protein n=1 Tax=Botryobasidium botryosum (strain FD-172 SS1) TaxID=930990 RepID=A0A067MQX9_BOTB1|nr:hypothetical protein BOTBODRAFT_225273 [Botryobasidium botryosum FD-172 SS1]